MNDRIPKYPGRTKMTRQDGSVEYVTLERADDPTQVGTPLNKDTLLKDSTAANLGLTSADPTVDEALANLLKYSTASPVVVKITESKTWTAPNAIGQKFLLLMSGGGGGASHAGGGSGYIFRDWVTIPEGEEVQAVVGAGGAPSTGNAAGGDGGATTFGTYATAEGGHGGGALQAKSGYAGVADGGDGGAGGGGYGDNSTKSASPDSSYGKGGDAGMYGGGGGGGCKGGKGGNGGKYGGGGGGGDGYGSSKGSGGIGGEFGGDGTEPGYGKVGAPGKPFSDPLDCVMFSSGWSGLPSSGGVNFTSGSSSNYLGGAGGGGYGSAGEKSASSSSAGSAGAGGGGYGGDAGNNGNNVTQVGTGGGGYGGTGGGAGGGGGLSLEREKPSSYYLATGYGHGGSITGPSGVNYKIGADGVIYILYYPED